MDLWCVDLSSRDSMWEDIVSGCDGFFRRDEWVFFVGIVITFFTIAFFLFTGKTCIKFSFLMEELHSKHSLRFYGLF